MAITATHDQFASKWGFVFAAIGSAVGLGNIWRFPFIAGENGGGAFILLYFIFIVSFGVPAVIAMIVIGRRGGQSPVGSLDAQGLGHLDRRPPDVGQEGGSAHSFDHPLRRNRNPTRPGAGPRPGLRRDG